jgi:hypothetical protein
MFLSFNENLLQVSVRNFFQNWKIVDPLLNLDDVFDSILSFFTTNFLFSCFDKLFSDFGVNMINDFLEDRLWRYKTFDIFKLLLGLTNFVDFIINAFEVSVVYFIDNLSTNRFNKLTNQITEVDKSFGRLSCFGVLDICKSF